MWKDWLAFTRKEQYGILFLTFLIFILLIIRLTLGFWYEVPESVDNTELSHFFEYEEAEDVKGSSTKHQFHFTDRFNPNEINVTALDEMGFSSYVVINWMKYLEAGGRFYSLSDIGKIYGVDSAALNQMKPYIRFSNQKENVYSGRNLSYTNIKKSDSKSKDRTGALTAKYNKIEEQELIILNVNEASAEDFRKIRGIGEVYSNRIVAYRKLLGGFYSVDQIKEVYGISKELFEDIHKSFEVSGGPFRKLKINQASIRELKVHPYVNFYQARDIIELRKDQGKIEDGSILKKLSSFDDKSLEKILPYFSFKDN